MVETDVSGQGKCDKIKNKNDLENKKETAWWFMAWPNFLKIYNSL